MKKMTAPETTKLTLSKTTIKNLGVQTGIQAGPFKNNTTACTLISKGVTCVP
jgi:hypothetical protein